MLFAAIANYDKENIFDKKFVSFYANENVPTR